MRQIILDTETTGLDPAKGHRIIEIGAVELINRRRTDNTFHRYLNPERQIEDAAFDVHGLSQEFLSDKPLFRDITQDFIDFIRGSELIIHNAPFDVGFINAELASIGKEWGKLEDHCSVIDTLKLARDRHPGQKNNLDALCSRYAVDNSRRDLHGALLDAQLLLDVYLAMTGGQASLSLEQDITAANENAVMRQLDQNRPPLRVIKATEQELKAHWQRLEDIDQQSAGQCIWKRMQEDS